MATTNANLIQEVDYLVIDRIHPAKRDVHLPIEDAAEWFRSGYCIDPETGEHYRLQRMHFKGSDHRGSWAEVRWRSKDGQPTRVWIENNHTRYVQFDYTV